MSEIQVGDRWLGTPEVHVGDGNVVGKIDTSDVHQVSLIGVDKRVVGYAVRFHLHINKTERSLTTF